MDAAGAVCVSSIICTYIRGIGYAAYGAVIVIVAGGCASSIYIASDGSLYISFNSGSYDKVTDQCPFIIVVASYATGIPI